MLSGRAICSLAAIGLLVGFFGPGGVRGQDIVPDDGQEVAAPTTPLAEGPESDRIGAPPARPAGSSGPFSQSSYYCDSPGLTVSRTLAFQSEDVAWRLVGLLPGSQVAPRLTDPLAPSSARTINLGSVLTSSVCEAIGSFSAVDLAPGTYTMSVAATTSRGEPIELTESLTILASPRPTPSPTPRPMVAAPSGVRAVAITSTTVRVDWIDNSSDESGFRIDGATSSFRTAPNVVSQTVGGLQPNAIHCFSVYALSDAGASYGGTACAMTPPPRTTTDGI